MATTDKTLLITVTGPDQVGMIAAVTGCLFGLGADLADTAFSVLGQGCHFSCIARVPADLADTEVQASLEGLDDCSGAVVTVSAFTHPLERTGRGTITHLVEMIAGDRPGLLARFSEAFGDYGVNIVRMTSRRAPSSTGEGYEYRTRFAINVPEGRSDAIDSLIGNIAGQLDLRYRLRDVQKGLED